MKYDLAVIGSGVIGTYHAYHAALKGLKVIVIEKDLFPQEASVRNFGQVVPSGFDLGRWHSYGRYSTDLYKSIQEKFDIGIRNNGSVYIASTPDELDLLIELKERFDANDYPSELLTKEQVLERYPAVNSDYAIAGLYFSQEVSAESRKMIHQLHAYLKEAHQVDFAYTSPVVEINDKGNEVEIQTSNSKKFIASRAIVCNGRDFRLLYPTIFSESNIIVCKLNMMVTKPIPEVQLQGNILTGLTIRRYESFKSLSSYKNLDWSNIDPRLVDNGIHVLFKQRIDGSIVIGDSHHYAAAATTDELGFDVDLTVTNLILEEAKNIIDLPSWEIAQVWNGFYAQISGEEEIFECFPTNNVKIVTAIGGKGMTASAGYSKESIDQFIL